MLKFESKIRALVCLRPHLADSMAVDPQGRILMDTTSEEC